ncbi:MAG TPA: tyrosine recombinase XerC [Limnobacter sp.]|nr:tyrosine recombinase XerC [Limnobacter sp.]
MCSAKSPTASQRLIQQYLDHLALERRQSPHTVTAVARDLAELGGDVITLTPQQLKTILGRRHAAGVAPRSLARMASSWRGFFRHLLAQGQIATNPTDGLKTPKVPKALPKALSVDEVSGLLQPPKSESFSARQARFLIELLYCTGMRISEALSLNLIVDAKSSELSHIDMSQAMIRVTGKGSKTRVIPIIESLMDSLQTYLSCRRIHLEKCSDGRDIAHLFVSVRGKPLSVRQAQLDVQRHGLQAGLTQHLHPHMLRHSFGSHVLQMSQNLRAVQELLGHASIASTQVYTALDFSHLTQVYDAAFPRAAGTTDPQQTHSEDKPSA